MYQLIFPEHTIKFNTIQEWHSKMCLLNKEGITYKEYKKCGYVWKFFF